MIGLLAGGRIRADEIAAADLQIQGVGLKVITVSASTGLEIPTTIQTEFGGKQNEQAQFVEGLLAVGELSGPGIESPIRLETAPGHKFQIPGLSREGIYFLQNIRLMKGSDFLQTATPSVATITVSNLLQTSVRVRQLTPDELRARGITIDARNFDVYEYTFSFLINGQVVEIPFPVVIDPRTHEVREIPQETPYQLPPINPILPPRWEPPQIETFEMGPAGDFPAPPPDDPAERGSGGRISIPAAIVIPNSMAVLHQFFAVALMVTNGAPSGSSVTLDSVTAQIKPPSSLRTVKSVPSVSFNQPVPIVDATTGVTFLIAQAKGEAEWTMEGLQPGTHTVEVEVRATYQSPGQNDFPLKGTARASVVVHDPRFNVTFSHPDVVRKDIEYSTYSFITNMSAVAQNIRVTNGVQGCAEAPGANVCRVEGTPAVHDLSIPPGEMRSIEYKLRPGITGHVFATAGSVSDDAISAQVQLHMGVSESGIPLSPATLVLPYYARFVSQTMVSANLQLLGLGYSLATAPLTQALARHPHVIRSDVFQRATDIARAGQRVFLGEAMRDSLAHMTLDLLGNSLELAEWDELRRREKSGRIGAASVMREIEASLGTATLEDFVSRYAAITAWRAPYLLAVSSSGKLSVRGVASNARLDVPSEATEGWVRQLPFAELNTFRNGEVAVVGRWSGDYEITVTLAADGPLTLDVIFPATTGGSVLRGHFDVTGTAGTALKLLVTSGATALELRDSLGGIAAVGTITPVSPEPIRILGARQDLNLEAGGHKVSVLWNRPVSVVGDLLQKFTGQVQLNRDGVNYTGPRPMSAAALQDGSRVANVTFDHALSRNATYSMTVGPLVDPISGAAVNFPDPVIPVIDNDRPGGILFGHVLKGDNSSIANAEVRLFLEGGGGPPQFDLSRSSDGAFLFEYVPRDIDNDLPGTYKLMAVTVEGKSTSVDGAVRLPGRVHFVNLVFLGRGSAEGFVRYDNNEIVPGARVVVGSTMFDQFRTTTADATGRYVVEDLPVGPLTFSATDKDGNVTYAASEIKTPGQVLQQDLSIFRRPFPGTGTIRGLVRRSDTNAAVAGAHVGVYSQGYGLIDGFTDSAGRFEFTKVPSGFVTVLAAEWGVSRESTALDFDLAANELRDVTLTLVVKPAEALVVIEGDVIREDPLHPGDAAFYQPVAGALVKIENAQTVTANASGHYIFSSVPVSFSTKKIQAYDPITTRTASTTIPLLDPTKVNLVPIFIATANGFGEGMIRVRLLSAAGTPVNNFRVIVPRPYPEGPIPLEAMTGGVYLLRNVPVGALTNIWAIGDGSTHGDQTASGTVKVEFNGHVAALTLRLPGQGTVRVKLAADIDVIGDVKLGYAAWDEAEQTLALKEITKSTSENGLAGFATFTGVPALQNFTASSAHPVYGYAAHSTRLGFDGDVQSITLQLNKLSSVRGVVYAIDGRTPVPGAAVRIEDGRQNPGIFVSRPDGTFEFFNVAAGVGFRVIADVTQDGVYRTGVVAGSTPALGGPVNGLAVIMRTQGGLDGRIVYAGYRVFDPQNPANNVPDNTPGDLSDNAPVPLANFVLRELDFPYRSFGTTIDPLTADVAGRFSINNVFTGPLRVSTSDPGNQEIRGTWTGSITQEGERVSALIGIGAEGFGPVVVTVRDPNAQNAPVLNAEVTLIKGFAPFDLSTTDANGTVRFEQVPVGSYKVIAYSKALGKSGGSPPFTVATVIGAQLVVVLEFSGKVDGKLSDPEAAGSGVPGVPVTLTEQSFQTRASTDVAGLFVFNGVREGLFRLDAKDTQTNRRATASRLLTQADPNPFVALELEPTETLYLSVYLPNDAGGNSNILASLVNLDVRQRDSDFIRALQGNSFVMPGLFRNERYTIAVKEVGGDARVINTSNTFPTGSSANPLKLVLPAYGSVEVRVTQGVSPAANAKVTVSGGGKTVTVFTDASGVGIASGIPLGSAFVQVVSVDGGFSGSTNTTITSQSTAAVVSITLGSFAGLSGFVEAETGGPSVGTRVIASFSTRFLEMLTDSTGRFLFQGIITPTTVNLVYMGPDDVTVGARQTVNITNADASKVKEVLPVKLDATPPLVTSIFPPDGAANVSPDSTVRVDFTEKIAASYINTNFFQLIPADSTTPVNTTFNTIENANGTFTVTMAPPAPPAGQVFPLKSNTLYRIIVSGEIRDLTGNKLPTTRGASFITSDYNEPKVLKVIPATTSALQPATTFEFRFNEPIDPAPWQTGGNGQFHLYKITAAGPLGAIIAEKPGRAFTDPAASLSLFFAPDDPIEQESFYRVIFSGVRDMQGNVLAPQTFHFFSYDLVKPFVILVSPVPTDFPLISGVEYFLGTDIRNVDANGPPATDVAKVDFFRVDGATPTYLATTTSAPWSYRFVAPDAPPAGSSLTLRAVATDLSGNESLPATMTWPVRPNQAPQNVVVAMTPPTSIYPGNHAFASVTFQDEGTLATVQVEAVATRTDNSEYKTSQVKNLTRQKVNDPWPAANFDFDLPATLRQGTDATFNASVTDVRGLKGTASATLNLLTDAINPEVLSMSPPAQTRYNIGQKFVISVAVKDMETGVAEVKFSFDNQTITVTRPSTLVTPAGDHIWLFTSGQITVPAKNVDTTIAITATAKDYNNNIVSRTTEVIYVGVNDPTVPKGAWLCPIEKAAYPAGMTMPVKLQVRATDDISVTAVKLTVPGVTDPIIATRVGTTDVYEATPPLTIPAAGQTLALTATISDANPEHDIILTIPVDSVAIDTTIDNFIQAITPADAPNYNNKSVLLRGAAGRLVPHVPVTLKNLIVLDGAHVETLFTTTTTERKLDLTITDQLFVDCTSSIDVSGRGYLGGWGSNQDGSGTRNNDQRGRTVGNTITGGASTFASASHAGIGGERSPGVTNAVYGSITEPTELGAGGGGGQSSNNAGGSGGGAIKLNAGIVAVAGAIRADGDSRLGDGNAGAGGSINIHAAQLVAGPAGRITANGGDDDLDGANSRGGGGGRIAIHSTDRFDVETVGIQIQARGGRNGTTNEGANLLDGGAGTIVARRPGQLLGELFSGSFDERFASTTHLTRPTPLSGTLRFDRMTVGARALARADSSLDVGGVIDDKTAVTIDPTGVLILNGETPNVVVTTNPVVGSSLIQAATLTVNYTATSAAGVGTVTTAFSPVTPDRVDTFPTHPLSTTAAPVVNVPATAVLGTASLTLTVADRAGRSFSLAPLAYTIIANTPPVIDQFDPIPTALYPGKSVSTAIAAHDDLKVTKVTFTRTIGTGTPTQTSINLSTPAYSNTFTDVIPITTPGPQTMTLDLAIEDGFPGRPGTTQTKTVSILKDLIPPAVSIITPVNDQLFNEGTGNTIQVKATINDAEVGVKEAFVQIDGGAQVALTKVGADYVATIPVPSVDGTEIVTKTLTVTAKDYEGNTSAPSVDIRIQPVVDPNGPVISWVCSTTGAMYPAGYGAKLRVFALGNSVGNPANGIQRIDFFVGDSTTPLTTTTQITGLANHYEVIYTIPADAVAGSLIPVRAVATNVAGGSEGSTSSFTIVAGTTITADTTISATNTTYENQTLIIRSGTTTIAGQHTFDKLIVLDSAKVTHAATDANTVQRLTFTATSNIFVSCTGSIDVSNRGITGSVNGTAYTYDRATDKPTLTGGAFNFSAGSHGGQGGFWIGNVPATFGSPFDPNEPGGAGADGTGTNCAPCRSGGGVARIRTATLHIDGNIVATGEGSSSAGAGGSIRIDADTIAGSGEIRASGGQNTGAASGGGGRVAIYYKTLSIPSSKITAAALAAQNTNAVGAPGTIYLRRIDNNGAKVSDELVIDNLGLTTNASTVIPTAGAGTVTAVNSNVVTVSAPVPFDIEGTWIAFVDGTGNVMSSYEITARSETTVTLSLGTGETAANAPIGAAYRGVVRVDRMTSRGLAIVESSAAAATTFTGVGSGIFRFGNVDAVAPVTLQGAIMEVNGTLTAPSLTLVGSTLTHSRTTATTVYRLNVNVAGATTIDATSAVDVSARGITGSVNGTAYTYDKETDKPTLTGGAFNFSAGSHGGRGGFWIGNVPAAYGSLFDPNEPGGAGADGTGTNCMPCRSGGGVARIKSGTLQLDGKVLANGEASSSAGAGGSIRIDAGTLSGAGEIHADGGPNTGAASGGGGRIAIYYKTLSIPTATITAAALVAQNTNAVGAPGTMYFRQIDDSGAKVTDEVVVDNLGRTTNVSTAIATAGTGTVTAVNGNVVTLSAAVPLDVEGTWIEFLDATGGIVSSYEIIARTTTTVTLRLDSGETAANAPIGSAYRGMLAVDRITGRGLSIVDISGVRGTTFTGGGAGLVRVSNINASAPVTLQSATLEVNGTLTAPSLTLLGSTLTHSRASATTVNRLNVNVAGTITVDATSAIDVSTKGITGSVNGTAYTYDKVTGSPTLTGGAFNFSAGSHGGQGGFWIGNVPSAYGSLFDPNEPGGAGAGGTGGTCLPCRSGGGVVRIKATTIQIDGKILANGEASSSSGAGGSIRIDAGTITGAGEIHADGAQNTGSASGGGGRIAIYYTTLSIPMSKITAAALAAQNANAVGAPGTIYLKNNTQPSGDLIVDNLARTTTRSTTLTAVGYATVTDFGTDFVKDANAAFFAPDQLRGVRVVVNYDRTKSWPIVSNDNKILRLDVTGQALAAEVGQPIRGLYKFDNLKLRNAKLDVIDLLEVASPIDKDAPSSIIGNNQARPLLSASLITLQSGPTGSAVIGAAGAVTDLDTPITLFATNTASGNVYTATAAITDGSFSVPVQGNTGDAVMLKARDANVYPLESPVIPVGNLTSPTPVPSQLNKSDWTTDTNFLPRTLSRDAGYLAVASYPAPNGSSSTLAILSVTDPAHPTLVRSLNTNNGTIKDVVVSNDWAFIAGDHLASLNLSDPNAVPISATGNPPGDETGIALAGSYVFTAENGWFNDGRIHIYDVSNPSAPRYIGSKGLIGSMQYTDVLPLGNQYLIAISGGTRDVVVIDRKDIYNLKVVATLDVPTFDGFRGTVVGTKLYLVSRTSTQFVVVDLSNPAAPAVSGTATMPAAGNGVTVLDGDGFAAIGASGLATLSVAAAPVLTGSTSVTGNAFDVAVIGSYLYVANELGIALVPAQVAPQISLSRISMSLIGTSVTITGAPQSVSGSAPVTVDLTDTATAAMVSTTVQSDGSFTASLAASPGDPITIKATDAMARSNGPLSLGSVPFGASAVTALITPAMTDGNFLARNVGADGNDLVVGPYTASDKIVLYDITNPASPIFKRTVATTGNVRDIAVSKGWAFVVGNRFGSLNLSDPNATFTGAFTGDPPGDESAIEIAGSYAFTAEYDWFNDGRIHIYDVSNPSAPRGIRTHAMLSGVRFTGLTSLGDGYLIGITSDRPGNVGHDVVVIDRRDLYNLRRVGDLDIPNFDGFRGKVSGTTLYVAGVGGGLAVVDLSNPALPVLKGVVQTPGAPRGVDAVGAMVMVADGSAGVTFLDGSPAGMPVILGTQPTGGTAWDCAFNDSTLYIANDQGLVVIRGLATAPIIDRTLITTTSTSGTFVTVVGAPKAITGVAPLTMELRNATTGASISGLSVAADGSFTASITGTAGNALTLKATDVATRVTGPLSIGTVPFGSQPGQFTITTAITDTGFFARNVGADGVDAVVASYTGSDKLVLFDVSNPSSPAYKRTVATTGNVRDVVVKNRWAYIVGNRFGTLNLADPTATFTPSVTGDPPGDESAVEIVGGFAFTTEYDWFNDGRIHIYDVSTPSAPRGIRTQALLSGVRFTGLLAMGSDYLIGISSDRPSNIGHDVVVIDRRDIYSLKKLGDIDIPNFDGFRGKVVGTTLYVAGASGGLAVVDVSNPLAPIVKGVMQTPGAPRAVDALGATVALADGSAGVTFLDGSPAGMPLILGGQPLAGTAWDCTFSGSTLYVANDQGLVVIPNLGTPPLIDTTLITPSSNGATTATVIGAPEAILGVGPMTLELRNVTTGASISGLTVGADGSFSGSIVGISGEALAVKVTDAVGRVAGPVSIGTVPFGSQTNHVTISAAMSDLGFLGRNVGADGNDAVLAPNAGSDKLVLFDVSTPGNPVYKRTVAGTGNTRDVVVSKGWAYVVGNRFGTLNLSDPNATFTGAITGDPPGDESAVEIIGGYAFTTEYNWFNDGRIHIYDVSSPSSPRGIRTHALLAGVRFTGLTSLGSSYLIGISPDRPGNVGHDVVVIDHRDLYNLKKVGDIDIPSFDGFRGKVVGTTLYVAGVGGGVAVVDLSNPTAPTLLNVITSAVAARGIDAAGTTLAVANGTNGINFVDVSSPSAPRILGSHAVPAGSAWDVALSRGAIYVASELGLTAIAGAALPPMLDESLLTITPAGASTTVAGVPQALTGIAPITARITNSVTAATSPTVTVNTNGSFSATVTALPAHPLTITATDVAGRVNARSLGATYGPTTTTLANQIATNDGNYRARRVSSNGTVTVVTTGSTFGTTTPLSSRMYLFRQPNASEPSQVITGGAGGVNDVTINSGYIYMAGNRFGTINLSDSTYATKLTGDPPGDEGAVAVSGGFAFTSELNWFNDGRIHIYNVSNPDSPVFVRSQAVSGYGSFWYRGLVSMGINYLIALSPDRPGGVDHDVTIIDRTNINNLVKITEMAIPNFDAFDGVIDGTTLYVAGGDGGVAIIDLANPFAPQLKSVVDTPGLARGVAISGPNEIVVTNGLGPGITFIDVTDKTQPIITGTQKLIGNVVDVDVVAKSIYVAAENYFHMILRP